MRALALTAYLGESDRAAGTGAAEAIGRLLARRGVALAALLRGMEGFGARHRLQTHRVLSLSEDLPLVWTAVDRPERIEALAEEIDGLLPDGLVTLERARLLGAGETPEPGAGELKLTVAVGRGERHRGRLVHLAVVDAMREAGVEGASVLLGVDGVREGRRRRARLIGANAGVPALVMAVGTAERLGRALPRVRAVAPGCAAMLERVRIVRRDGAPLLPPGEIAPLDPAGLGVWQKVSVFAAEDAAGEHGPLYADLVLALREAGAAGATVLGGVWGYSGRGRPHGDRALRLARRIPVIIVAIDRPHRMRALWPTIDRLTGRAGLVTSELVPAFRARAGDERLGGLRLARALGDASGP